MLTDGQVFYQTNLVLKCLPKYEYKKVPKEIKNIIENNMEVDKSIVIDPSKSLEEQNLDLKTIQLLDTIARMVEREENSRKIRVPVMLDKDNSSELKKKLEESKALFEQYKKLVSDRDKEILNLRQQIVQCENRLEKIPRFIRRIWIKDELKALKDKN